jgi:hypothetical protein
MFQVEVFWDVTPYSVVVGYQRFGGPCCIHLQGEVEISGCYTIKKEGALLKSSEINFFEVLTTYYLCGHGRLIKY